MKLNPTGGETEPSFNPLGGHRAITSRGPFPAQEQVEVKAAF